MKPKLKKELLRQRLFEIIIDARFDELFKQNKKILLMRKEKK